MKNRILTLSLLMSLPFFAHASGSTGHLAGLMLIAFLIVLILALILFITALTTITTYKHQITRGKEVQSAKKKAWIFIVLNAIFVFTVVFFSQWFIISIVALIPVLRMIYLEQKTAPNTAKPTPTANTPIDPEAAMRAEIEAKVRAEFETKAKEEQLAKKKEALEKEIREKFELKIKEELEKKMKDGLDKK